MKKIRLQVETGDYSFVTYESDHRVHVFRRGEPHETIEKYNATLSLMLEVESLRKELCILRDEKR